MSRIYTEGVLRVGAQEDMWAREGRGDTFWRGFTIANLVICTSHQIFDRRKKKKVCRWSQQNLFSPSEALAYTFRFNSSTITPLNKTNSRHFFFHKTIKREYLLTPWSSSS